ncbi:helix-turn-helix transcriptional regulator [Paraburkholderia tuberum]|uniref:Transcriptional regulator, AlpA family n=1 Tax=Paraburkholderia tuberum TaxID=157910 RepID=A0A1H0ZNW6_9BURK|nr:AlpA family phage regulatory protein [Paraburkholderia tuberum]SDQ29092.1 transcriptional regulator, AlpA family [Paraburkholderia tuberum]
MHPVISSLGTNLTDDRHLRPNAAAEYLGIGLSTLFKYAKYDPTFPKGIKLSTKCTVYSMRSLAEWVHSKRAA